MKIEIVPVSFSPSSDFLQRETDNIILYHSTYPKSTDMFINYEREIIMKIEVGPAELLSPLHPFSFFVFPLTVLTNPS